MTEKQSGPKSAAGVVIPVLMPQAGQSMEEGTIVKWLVQLGERITVGQMIMEIETDKATIEVEATDAGRLARIVAGEDATVAVLQPVAYLAESDADVDAWLAGAPAKDSPAADSTAAAAPIAKSDAPATRTDGGRIKASPAARKIAAERGADLEQIGAGSGPYGRILSIDALKAPGGTGGAAASQASGGVRHKLSSMRRAIASNLLASKQNIPHFYLKRTIDAAPLYRFYKAEKERYPCSVNDVIVLACARTMHEFPAFRSQLDGDELIEFPHANIGIAVGLDKGLVVPVIVEADNMNLRDLAAYSRRIVESARQGKIENMGRGNFTISNLGMFGVEEFSAIINPPEAAILAVGALRDAAVVENGALRAGRVVTLTLSCDHRIVDGVLAAQFAARLKELLEAPERL